MATALITGASQGIGACIAKRLAKDGYNVAINHFPSDSDKANAEKVAEECRSFGVEAELFAANVADYAQCEAMTKAVKERFGSIDALVNNAGIGLLSPLEGLAMDNVREIFETNTLGTIAMTQAVLPQLRRRQAGVVVNVTSSVTLKPFPLLSVYTASKAAVNAFTASLALELQPFGIRAHLILPGRAPATRFGENARRRMSDGVPDAYTDFMANVFAGLRDASSPVTHADEVAEAVWRAVTDASTPLRLPAGADAMALATGA